MTKALSKLEIIVLEWVSADYETLSSIEESATRSLGREVPGDEIREVLVQLQQRGLVESYSYDRSTGRYLEKPVDPNGQAESYCWLATQAGQRLVGMEPDGP